MEIAQVCRELGKRKTEDQKGIYKNRDLLCKLFLKESEYLEIQINWMRDVVG